MSHSEDDLPEFTQETQETQQEIQDVGVPGPSAKKRYRPLKREIPDYPFTMEQHEDVAAFVRRIRSSSTRPTINGP